MSPSAASVSRVRAADELNTRSGCRPCSRSQSPAARASARPVSDSGRSRSSWPDVADSAWAWRSRISWRMDTPWSPARASVFLKPLQQRLPVGLVLAHLCRVVVEQAFAQPGEHDIGLAVAEL